MISVPNSFLRYLASRLLRLGLVLALLSALSTPAFAEVPPPSAPPTLTLADAISRAFKASPRLDAARAGIAAAAGSELQASLWPNPEASFEMENFVGTGPYSGTSNADVTAGLSQLIELGGKRDARQRAAAAAGHVAQADLSAAELDLVREVTVAYMEVVGADESARLAADLEGTARKVLSDVSRRVDAARDPLFQRSRAEVALTNATIARQRAEAAAAAARQKLARYWGEPTTEGTLAAGVFFVASAPAPLSDYREKLARTPDLLRYDELREQREADLSLARAGAIPDVRASFGLRRFPGTSDTALVAGVSLPIPVFNQNQGEIARAGAEVNRVRHEQQQTALEREQALIQAWNDWQSAWNEAKALKEKAIPQAERAFRLALGGYRVGGFQYLDVLDAQRAFFETRNALILALTRMHNARAQAERLAGTTPFHDMTGTP
jgi:cobalt-zinc-cadmium efflux system outer membrane protein